MSIREIKLIAATITCLLIAACYYIALDGRSEVYVISYLAKTLINITHIESFISSVITRYTNAVWGSLIIGVPDLYNK